VSRIVIVAAKRTPQGKFLGTLWPMSAADLGVAAAKAALASSKIDPAKIDQVIVGNVLSAGVGQSVGRQIGIGAGVPVQTPAYTVNMMCASGMQAVILAAQAIRAGDARVVLCGGAESMSNSPFLVKRAVENKPSGDAPLDSIVRDGLSDAFDRQHMGLGAERLAEMYKITRREQDEFAIASQAKWAAAQEAGRFNDQIITTGGLAKDEHPRPGTAVEKLATLRTVFKENGTVTAGNASGINDGAAMMVVTSEETAKREGWPVLAVMRGWATAGCEPGLFGLGPVHATRKLCAQSGLKIEDFDAIEINEAFAAQTIACLREMPQIAPQKLNIDGGAIALGHPIGASGARLLVHQAQHIRAGRWRRTLATLCVGGGMGAAVALEEA